jgi:hypothetical protein
MKLLIPFLILLFSFCNFKKDQVDKNIESEKKADMLLLKLNWLEGDVTILRNNEKLVVQNDLELEKEDLIGTGANGSIELLLGLDHYIKIGNNSKVSVTNLLTTTGETVTSIFVNEGKVLVLTDVESKEEFNLITANAFANTNGSILIAQTYPNSNKSKDSVCNKTSCSTKLIVLNGNARIKNAAGNNDFLLDKKFQIHVSKEEDLAQNKILPLDKNSISEIKSMLTFHTSEPILDSKLLDELKVTPEVITKPTLPKIVKKKALPIQKIPAKKTPLIKKAATLNKPLSKNTYKDKLKLEPNKRF